MNRRGSGLTLAVIFFSALYRLFRFADPPRPPLHSLSPNRLEYLEASEDVVLELSVDEVVVLVSSLSSEDMITAASGVDELELFAVLLLVFVLVLVDPFGSIRGHLARDLVCFSMELTADEHIRI